MTRLQRLFRIAWVFCRYRLDTFLPLAELPVPLKVFFLLAPWHLFPKPKLDRGDRLRLAFEELGPVFVKFGQILSTRRDLLPDDMALSLKHLQDRVPPFPGDAAQSIIEKSLGAPVSELFAEFSREPMASASVAQVHAATLLDGREVVVKVIRPGIERVIRQDLALMYMMAGLLERYWSEGRRLHPVEVVADYDSTIHDELDQQREAANASQLRRNFENSSLIYIPSIDWDYTRKSVLVMERIHGIPIADVPALREAGVNLKVLAEKGVEIFFTQVFRDSFFHADMHPGNIFVDVSNPADPKYIAIDFGIVGTLAPDDQSYLARNLLAFFRRDYRQVAELHIQSGWVPPDTRVNEFEAAIRTVCEPIFEKPLKDISFGHFFATAVPDGAALQHGGATATGAAAENPVERGRSGAPALPGSGPVEHRSTLPGSLDAQTHRPVRPDQIPAVPFACLAGAIAGNATTGTRRAGAVTQHGLQRPPQSRYTGAYS